MDEVEKLIEQLRSGDIKARSSAAHQLGEIKDKRAVPLLIEALKDGDCDVRWKATGALGKIGGTRAVSALIETLRFKSYWGVQVSVSRMIESVIASRRLESIIEKTSTIEELEEVEKGIDEGSAALRKRGVDEGILINTQIEIAKLTRKIAQKKDELAPKKDLLLDDRPKPPKKDREVYHTARRVRNG